MQNWGQGDLTDAFDSPDASPVRIRCMLASRLDLPVELTCSRNYHREENV
jgi:hypothetical protein